MFWSNRGVKMGEVRIKSTAELSGILNPQQKAALMGYIGRGVRSVSVNDDGELVFIMSDGAQINLGALPTAPLPIASSEILGGIKIGGNLKIDENGVLSVDTATEVMKDNTKPITSGAVFTEVGNIEELLKAL